MADAIYVLNYVVNKELSKKRRKKFAFFADLRAAFESGQTRVEQNDEKDGDRRSAEEKNHGNIQRN